MTQWKNGFIRKLHSTANLNFLLLSLFVYLLNNSSSQFFSYWESAVPMFSSLPNKNQNKSMTLSSLKGKFKFDVLWGFFIKPFFHWATLNLIFGRNLEFPTIVRHSDIADAFSFQKRRIQMILPNATSFDTLGPRKAFTIITKGQLISEWLFDVLNFPKKQPKKLMNFYPRI